MKTAFTIQKNKPFSNIVLAFVAMFFTSLAFAQTGGLDQATTTVDEIKTWAYGFLGVGVFCYIIYNVIMALLDRKQWSEVLMAVVYTALAGAALVVTDWAWGLWGS